jgi:hypothetical protein
MSQSLPEKLLAERDRVLNVVIPQYEFIGTAGVPALTLVIRPALKLAEDALLSGDAVDQLRALKELAATK